MTSSKVSVYTEPQALMRAAGKAANDAASKNAFNEYRETKASHTSVQTRTWLEAHPRIQQVFIPKGGA